MKNAEKNLKEKIMLMNAAHLLIANVVKAMKINCAENVKKAILWKKINAKNVTMNGLQL